LFSWWGLEPSLAVRLTEAQNEGSLYRIISRIMKFSVEEKRFTIAIISRGNPINRHLFADCEAKIIHTYIEPAGRLLVTL
jgi:hypothetical protein